MFEINNVLSAVTGGIIVWLVSDIAKFFQTKKSYRKQEKAVKDKIIAEFKCHI